MQLVSSKVTQLLILINKYINEILVADKKKTKNSFCKS